MTPEAASIKAEALCNLAPVIPVLVLDDVATARPLAEALVAGGLPVLEVTLRTQLPWMSFPKWQRLRVALLVRAPC